MLRHAVRNTDAKVRLLLQTRLPRFEAAPAAAAGGASAGGGGGHGVRGDAKRARQAGGGASAGPGLPAGPCGDRASRQKAAALAIKALRERTAEAAAAQAAGKPLGELLVEAGWKQALGPALSAQAFGRLEAFMAAERAARTPVYPPAEHTFAAFHATPLSDVRVVVLGQDPYHGSGQAMGLSFSVRCVALQSVGNARLRPASERPAAMRRCRVASRSLH